MSMKPATVRTRNIHLSNIDNARITALITDLQNLEGINEARVDAATLTIVYQFPETGFDSIREIINRHTNAIASSLRHTLTASMEQIEREHLLSQSGWDIYTRDIYVANHLRETERRSKQPRKPWQQAKRQPNS